MPRPSSGSTQRASVSDDPCPTELNSRAQAELAAAVHEEREQLRAEAGKEGKAAPAAKPTGKSRFHTHLGILGVSTCKRAGVKCLHCQCSIQKGDVKFAVAYSLSKPERSIHTSCLVQFSPASIQNSMPVLESALTSLTDPDQRDAVMNAIRTFKSM